MQVETTYIYTLSHPVTNEVRYVGKADNLISRLKYHLWDKKKSHRADWIKLMREQNLIPKIEQLDIVSKEEWKFWEQYWIAQFKAWGFNLTNLTNGGEGVVGYKFTDEVRRKMSDLRKGIKFSPEHCKNMARTGEKHPMYGKKHSEESLKKMSESHKGQIQSEQQRKKQSEFLKAKYANGYAPTKGLKWTQKQRELIIKSRVGKIRNGIKVLNITTGIFYNSAKEAFNSTNLKDKSGFYRRLSGFYKNKTDFIKV